MNQAALSWFANETLEQKMLPKLNQFGSFWWRVASGWHQGSCRKNQEVMPACWTDTLASLSNEEGALGVAPDATLIWHGDDGGSNTRTEQKLSECLGKAPFLNFSLGLANWVKFGFTSIPTPSDYIIYYKKVNLLKHITQFMHSTLETTQYPWPFS